MLPKHFWHFCFFPLCQISRVGVKKLPKLPKLPFSKKDYIENDPFLPSGYDVGGLRLIIVKWAKKHTKLPVFFIFSHFSRNPGIHSLFFGLSLFSARLSFSKNLLLYNALRDINDPPRAMGDFYVV